MNTTSNIKRFVKSSTVAVFLLANVCIGYAHAGIIFNLSSDDIEVGDTFSIDVIFDNPNEFTLEGFAFDINDEDLQTVNYDGDSLIDPNFLSFPFGFDIDKFVIAPFPGVNSSEILLATLNFTALSAGTETLTLLGNDQFSAFSSGLFLDAFSSYEAIDSSITFEVNEVPEPSTLAIMLLALTTLASRIWKRQSNS